MGTSSHGTSGYDGTANPCVYILLHLLAPPATLGHRPMWTALRHVPLETTLREWVYYFLPYYWLLVSTFAGLNGRSRSALVSDVYAVVQCIPLTLYSLIDRPRLDPYDWLAVRQTVELRLA